MAREAITMWEEGGLLMQQNIFHAAVDEEKPSHPVHFSLWLGRRTYSAIKISMSAIYVIVNRCWYLKHT